MCRLPKRLWSLGLPHLIPESEDHLPCPGETGDFYHGLDHRAHAWRITLSVRPDVWKLAAERTCDILKAELGANTERRAELSRLKLHLRPPIEHPSRLCRGV